MASLRGYSIVAVHAHPDDESIFTGLLLANAARRGADVHVLTCTLGEEGEVIGEKYHNLEQSETGLLGGYRIAELQRALRALGLAGSPEFLGGVGAWRDSGMAGSSSMKHPRAFAQRRSGEEKDAGARDARHGRAAWDARVQNNAEALEARAVGTNAAVGTDESKEQARRYADIPQAQVEQLIAQLAPKQPDVLVTYDPSGGYGHPDHIRAHEITHAAVASGRLPSVRHILWAVTEQQRVHEALREAVVPQGWRHARRGDIAGVDSSVVDWRLRASKEDMEAQRAALHAHATQVWCADGSSSDVNPQSREVPAGTPLLWCLSNLIAQPLLDTESYRVGFSAPGVQGQSNGQGTIVEAIFTDSQEAV